jgi:hypothetical protein
MFLFQSRDRLEILLKLLLGQVDGFVDCLAFVVRQGGKVVRLDDLAVAHARDGKTHRRTQDCHVATLGFFHQFFKGVLLACRKPLLKRTPAALILLGVKKRRDVGGQIVDQRFHRLLQRSRGAGRHGDGLWLIRACEVIHVDPVRRNRPARCFGIQQGLHGGMPTCASRPKHEEVEVGMRHAGRHLYGTERTFLPDQTRQRFEGRGVFEIQKRRIAADLQVFQRQQRGTRRAVCVCHVS